MLHRSKLSKECDRSNFFQFSWFLWKTSHSYRVVLLRSSRAEGKCFSPFVFSFSDEAWDDFCCCLDFVVPVVDFGIFSIVWTRLILISGIVSDGAEESSLSDEAVDELSLMFIFGELLGMFFNKVSHLSSTVGSVFRFGLKILRNFSSKSSCLRKPLSTSVSSRLWSEKMKLMYSCPPHQLCLTKCQKESCDSMCFINLLARSPNLAQWSVTSLVIVKCVRWLPKFRIFFSGPYPNYNVSKSFHSSLNQFLSQFFKS